MHHTTRRRPPSYRIALATSVLLLVAAQLFVIVDNARGATRDYGSGPTPIPTSAAVVSTADYTSRSQWMIFGDSITLGGYAYKTLAAQRPTWRLAVNAQSSRGTTATVTAAINTPDLPAHVIMAVGSNDVPNPPVMAAQIKRLRDALEPRGITVYWGTVHVVRTRGTAAQQLADQRNSGWVNAQIQAGCTAPCRVIDWGSFLAGYPSYRIPAYLRDGVHLSDQGKAPWSALISGAIR